MKANRALEEPKRARAIFSRESKIKKKRSDVRLTPKCLQGQSSIVAMKLLTKSFSKWLWLACFRAVGKVWKSGWALSNVEGIICLCWLRYRFNWSSKLFGGTPHGPFGSDSPACLLFFLGPHHHHYLWSWNCCCSIQESF